MISAITTCKGRLDSLRFSLPSMMEYADEVIVVGGHLDAWDKGDGAHDNGAGCMQSIEVLYLSKKLDKLGEDLEKTEVITYTLLLYIRANFL